MAFIAPYLNKFDKPYGHIKINLDLLTIYRMNESEVLQAKDIDMTQLHTKEFFVLLFTLMILGVLFVIGIGTNSILLLAFHRRPNLRTVSNR